MVFQAKFGRAGEVASEMIKGQEMARQVVGDHRARILTDLSGQFDTIVQELEVESLAEWERVRAKMFSDPRFREMTAGGRDLIEGGRTEFYTIEG